MHKLMDYICEQLEDLERKAEKEGKLSMAEIEYLDKLSHIKKNLLAADEMWDESEYSNAGEMRDDRYYRRSYRGSRRDEGGSYAPTRGRGANARRDAMGRYSNDSEEMVDELRDLMHDAPDQQTKQDLQRIVNRLESM